MHILTASGREIVLGPGIPPRWGPTVRTIAMSPSAKVDAQPKTLLGRSTGRWVARP